MILIAWRRDSPEILKKEIERRREFGTVAIDDEIIPPQLEVVPHLGMVTLATSRRYATVHATRARTASGFGKWIFEVCVEKMPYPGTTISIGFDVPRRELQWKEGLARTPRGSGATAGQIGKRGVALPGITPGGRDRKYGLAWQCDARARSSASSSERRQSEGVLHAFGNTKAGMPVFQEGDVITVLLNQDSAVPYVQFYRNGELAIPRPKGAEGVEISSFTGHGKKKEAKPLGVFGIPIRDRSAYELVPAACFYATDLEAKHKPALSFNFSGPFEHPVTCGSKNAEAFGSLWPEEDEDGGRAHFRRSKK